ncbi:MAG TPA: tetraacyldisaccharide 4'-kinase [Steroidobacteraceae bacterium]|nr:tetraacyldisaccharide 4'-kinase [Steroidobacteraceae bacterium]
MSLEAGMQRLWYGPAWRTLPLWPFALLFRFVVALRRTLYRSGLLRSQEAGVPVVVVGNVTVGGTGKTPVAAWLARQLGLRGLRVGVVLRGYRGSHRGSPKTVELSDNPAIVGDEALLHARRGVHAVVIGADRVAAARQAGRQGAEIVVCDDGLQHLRLARDYEIAVIDSARRLGNGWTLPAGPLREPAVRLEAVNAVIATQRRSGTAASELSLRGPMQLTARLSLGPAINLVTGERQPLESFPRSVRLHAAAGVGHPAAFFAALRDAGLSIVEHALADHAALDPAALPFPADASVLMTEKDAVKCRQFARPGWWWVDLDVEVDRAEAEALLASILERTGLARAGVPLG